MKSAIITGANGFVGRALLRELSERGVEGYALVRSCSSGADELREIPGVHVIPCAMEEIGRLPDLIHTEIDAFYHLAWSGGTGPARGDYELQLSNVKWTLDAVTAAASLGCKRFIGAGSCAEMDISAGAETDGLVPNVTSHYGSAKIAAHYMSKAECGRLKIDHIWAKLANIYGVGDHSSNFINFTANLMLTGQPANFTAGEQLYDFACVSDIAQGLYRLGQKGKPNVSYYVGSAQPRKLKEFIRILRDEIDPSIPLHLGAVLFHGVSLPKYCFDCGPLMRDTGYSPQIMFEDGIKPVIKHLRQKINAGSI